MSPRRYESEFMNVELTNSFLKRSDSKMARRSLLGMTVAGLAGSLIACATAQIRREGRTHYGCNLGHRASRRNAICLRRWQG
jgi:hypothetical protein